jgi:hypothetical protein
VAAIEAVEIPPGKTAADVAFDEVRGKLSTRVSRVPVWDSNKLMLHVIHESMIYRFLADSVAMAATGGKPTLDQFLAYDNMRAIVSNLAYVSQGGTLADAKKAMASRSGCQDVVVTATGSDKEPVLGWITNAAIATRDRN